MSRNQYDGNCYKCGLVVKAGTGHFERIPFKRRGPGDPKWRTQHAYYPEHGGVTCEMAKATLTDLERAGAGNGLK